MNRRHFFAITLPALLGGAALKAMANSKPEPKPSPRRIKIEVDLLASALKPGNTTAHTILVVTEEDVATYASFLQMYTFQEKGSTSMTQAIGPYLRVTPHIESDGKITVNAKVQFEEATSNTAPPDQPLPINSNSLAVARTVDSGHAVILGGLVVGSDQKQVQLTATILEPHQMV